MAMSESAPFPTSSSPVADEQQQRGHAPPHSTDSSDSSDWGILSPLRPLYEAGLNLLLVFVPLGFVASLLGWHAVTVSAFNFLAIIPLSALISDASDTIGDRWGSLVGGLVNASFGNTVELIVGILAISHGELRVAQSIMLGSILSDLLMVLGFCIITAARGHGVISVNPAIVDTMFSLMLISTMALVLPTALYSTFPDTAGGIEVRTRILSFSRATAAVLLVIYGIYLHFQLKTHASLFIEEEDDADHEAYGDVPGALSRKNTGVPDIESEGQGDGAGDDDADPPSMREVGIAAAVLAVSGLLIANCTHAFMASLDGMTQTLGITKAFVAIIIIPIASNAPELTQVVAAARKQKINFAVVVIVSSILQIFLFVLPILVVIGWLMDRPMDLCFEASQTYTLLFAVILVNQVLEDRQYTYLHGVMLLSVYTVIAMAYYVKAE